MNQIREALNDTQRLARVKRMALAFQRHDWEQGVVAQAFLEAGDENVALSMALAAAARQTGDGRCSQLGTAQGITDPCAIGEVLFQACEWTGDAALYDAKERLLTWALHDAPRNGEGIVYHLLGAREFWVDSMYMLPPFLAKAGHPEEAIRQLDGLWAALYLEDEGLLAHRWDDAARRYVRREPWGVGNGWALAGMARVIDALPDPFASDRRRMIDRVRALLDAVLARQMEDGRFHDVLNDTDSFPEVNCAQMVAYTIYRGVAGGWLGERYVEHAERCREAAVSAVDCNGIVRGVCGLPDFDKPGVAPEAQAFHILMEVARNRWRA